MVVNEKMEIIENSATTTTPTANQNEQLVYLNFKGRIPKEILQENVFFKVANLHKEGPLVQVNDLLFKGAHDYAVGSNLFFNKQESSSIPSTYPFEKSFPIDLSFLAAETKVINCEQVKLKPNKIVFPQGSQQDFKFNLDCNYEELLKKFQDGKLDLRDMVDTRNDTDTKETEQTYETNKKHVESVVESENMKKIEAMQVVEETDNSAQVITDTDMCTLENSEAQILEKEYNKLVCLARKPVKTKIWENEEYNSREESIRSNVMFKNIECKVTEPPHFSYQRNVDQNPSDDNLCYFIDLERCKLFGLLESTDDFPRSFTEEEKKRLLVLENIDLLALEARYILIQCQVEKLEDFMKNVPPNVLKKVDKFGHNTEETLQVYKKLRTALEKRITEIKCLTR